MELWIRSQDKRTLVNTRRIDVDDTNIIIWDEGKYASDVFMGEYKTKERALEVLDEIQERMINNSLINRKIYADNFKKVYDLKSDELKSYITEIYEMPEE